MIKKNLFKSMKSNRINQKERQHKELLNYNNIKRDICEARESHKKVDEKRAESKVIAIAYLSFYCAVVLSISMQYSDDIQKSFLPKSLYNPRIISL